MFLPSRFCILMNLHTCNSVSSFISPQRAIACILILREVALVEFSRGGRRDYGSVLFVSLHFRVRQHECAEHVLPKWCLLARSRSVINWFHPRRTAAHSAGECSTRTRWNWNALNQLLIQISNPNDANAANEFRANPSPNFRHTHQTKRAAHVESNSLNHNYPLRSHSSDYPVFKAICLWWHGSIKAFLTSSWLGSVLSCLHCQSVYQIINITTRSSLGTLFSLEDASVITMVNDPQTEKPWQTWCQQF